MSVYPLPKDQRRIYFHCKDYRDVNIHEQLLDSKQPNWREYYTDHETFLDAKGETHYTDDVVCFSTYEALSFWLYRGSKDYNEAAAIAFQYFPVWLTGGELQPTAVSAAIHVYLFAEERGWHGLMDEVMTWIFHEYKWQRSPPSKELVQQVFETSRGSALKRFFVDLHLTSCDIDWPDYEHETAEVMRKEMDSWPKDFLFSVFVVQGKKIRAKRYAPGERHLISLSDYHTHDSPSCAHCSETSYTN